MFTFCFTKFKWFFFNYIADIGFTITLDSQRPLASRAAFTSNNNYKLSNQVTLQKDMPTPVTGEAYVRVGIWLQNKYLIHSHKTCC